ncbi:MAG: FxsA cytoplasmic rane protein [Acidimicrobiales bacterium]|nr:FxsA cytoplasmic rane protein [Acidimicrobiales bacterium]
MLAVLALLFILIPLAEIWVIVQVGQAIGVLNTFGLLVLSGIIGGWLMKREGLAVWRRAQASVERGQVPTKELIDGVLILGGGALMVAPGFITDIVGMLLLLPPVRAAIRALVRRRIARRADITIIG